MTPLQRVEKISGLALYAHLPFRDAELLAEWAWGNAELPSRLQTLHLQLNPLENRSLKEMLLQHLQIDQAFAEKEKLAEDGSKLALVPTAVLCMKVFGIEKGAAYELADWLHDIDGLSSFWKFDDAVIDRIFMVLDLDIAPDTGDILRNMIWDAIEIYKKQSGIKEARGVLSSLEALSFALVLKSELGVSMSEAKQLIAWMSDEDSWESIDERAKQIVLARWELSKKPKHAGYGYHDWVQDEIADLLRKHDLDPRELL